MPETLIAEKVAGLAVTAEYLRELRARSKEAENDRKEDPGYSREAKRFFDMARGLPEASTE